MCVDALIVNTNLHHLPPFAKDLDRIPGYVLGAVAERLDDICICTGKQTEEDAARHVALEAEGYTHKAHIFGVIIIQVLGNDKVRRYHAGMLVSARSVMIKATNKLKQYRARARTPSTA